MSSDILPSVVPAAIPELESSGARAAFTTRRGGASAGPYAGFNLGLHTGDDPERVRENRRLLLARLPGAERIFWLRQIHSDRIVRADGRAAGDPPEADGAFTREKGTALAIMTADCLPVLVAARDGSAAGAAHCGWRGLAAGILDRLFGAMDVPPGETVAWLGPCIGPDAFEVGPDVRAAFLGLNPAAGAFFRKKEAPGGAEKYLADLPGLAEAELRRIGVGAVRRANRCTFSDAGNFFSYRRDRVTGRMASLVWLV